MSTCKMRVSYVPGPEYAFLGLAAISKNSIVKTSHKAGNREIGYIKGMMIQQKPLLTPSHS